MNFTIKNEYIEKCNGNSNHTFPKYTTQLINWANQNAQGTRPVVVGQMSDLFPEFITSGEEITIESWKNWYTKKHPDAFDKATNKIYYQIQNLKNAIQLIDEEMVRQWVIDLLINKTFNGLYFQKAILSALAIKTNTSYRLATPDEESKGIDGFVGSTPYSIKPDTYKTMDRLSETIDVKIIYYKKSKTGLKIEVEE